MTTKAKEKMPLVRVSRTVDKRTIVRDVKQATPSTCLECGFNVMQPKPESDGAVPPWDELDPEEQAAIKAVLRRHHKKAHPEGIRNRAVVKEEDVAKSWTVKPRPI